MTRIIVCGGRNYTNRERLFKELDAVHSERHISVLIEGGARGADRLAFEWGCQHVGILKIRCEADWVKHGRAAGPIRNQRMLNECAPDLVVAFPGGSGTADMVRRARDAGVEVIEVKYAD